MCIISTKITKLGGRLICQQGGTSWVWYYFFNVAGSRLLPYNRGLVDRAAGSNHRDSRSIPGRAEHVFVDSSKIMKFLLKTYDRRGGTPDLVILSAIYALAKTREREGQLLLTQYLYGNCLLYLMTLFISRHCLCNCLYSPQCLYLITLLIWAAVINTFLVLCTYYAALAQGSNMSPGRHFMSFRRTPLAKFVKFLRTRNSHIFWRKYVNDCFWNLFKSHQDCPFLITYTSGSSWDICFTFVS